MVRFDSHQLMQIRSRLRTAPDTAHDQRCWHRRRKETSAAFGCCLHRRCAQSPPTGNATTHFAPDQACRPRRGRITRLHSSVNSRPVDSDAFGGNALFRTSRFFTRSKSVHRRCRANGSCHPRSYQAIWLPYIMAAPDVSIRGRSNRGQVTRRSLL